VFGGTMPLANRLFTGRGDLLAAMHTALAAEDASAALTQTAVHGLGGVGKTSLAREYIERHAADYPGGVWWIAAADRAGTMEGLAALARALDPRVPEDIPAEDAAKAALAEVGRRHAPFLLVYDNAPDPASLSGLLPKRGAKVLITSRHPGWNRQAMPLRVDAMAEDDAVALLQAVAEREDEAGARRLARELGCLPLALDQAGAYARETQISFDDYAAQVGELLGRGSGNPDYPESVAATFALAIAKAAQNAPAAEAVIGLFAWYAPERIPLLLLETPPAERAEAIAALSNLSLIAAAEKTTLGPAVTVHRLVQAVMRDRMAWAGAELEFRDRAIIRLKDVFPVDVFRDPSRWPICRDLLLHVRSLQGRIPLTEATLALANLLSEADGFLGGSGDALGAVDFCRRALAIRERLLGAEHPQTLESVNNLAFFLCALGDAEEALPISRRAVEGSERVLGAEHSDTFASMNNLANCLRALGETADALQLYRRALQDSERALGVDDPVTVISLGGVADCLKALGDPAGALPLFQRALE
jgi:tetratricopeptide (TPR) repeat protein